MSSRPAARPIDPDLQKIVDRIDAHPADRQGGPLSVFLSNFDPRRVVRVHVTDPPDFATLPGCCRLATYVDRRSVGYQFNFSDAFSSVVWVDLNRAVVRKTPLTFQQLNIHATEIGWLKRLGGSGIAPSFIGSRDHTMLATSYIGEPVTPYNIPPDWRLQAERILAALKAHNCAHNDIHAGNILVAKRRLSLIDFAWATEIGAPSPAAWPVILGAVHRIDVHQFDDRKAIFEALAAVSAQADDIRAGIHAEPRPTPPAPAAPPRQ